MANIELKVYNQKAEEVSTLKLDKSVFGVEVNEGVIFDAVMVYQANSRQATAKTKKRFEVSGGGKKPWRQKGTGRARAGSTRSPIWVGGGTVFGPTGIQSFKVRQNRKEHSLALKSALTLKVKGKGLLVLDELKVEGKTKEIKAMLDAFKVSEDKCLVVTSDELVLRAANNLPNVVLRDYKNVSVYDLMNASKVLINKDEIKEIEEALK